MSWLYFAVGIVCLIALQALRSVLALVVPVSRPRLSVRPDARHVGGFDLFDATSADFEALGFEGPTWVVDESTQTDAAMARVHAVYRNREHNVLAWVAPGVDVSQPNMPLTYYTTALQGGRYAVTQVSDPYFFAIADELTPAQTITPSDRATELQQHLEFVARQEYGAVPASTSENDMLRFAGDHMNGTRQRLLRSGKLSEVDGIARPTFLFGLRVLWQLITRPKAKTSDPQPIPAARLVHLANVVRAAKTRAPAQATQWALLIMSALLFIGIGWPLFGLDIAAILLGVILFHEVGHWVAMRAFGYRNPHITLLPLLGGVTIGHETDPSAAKRAWVGLAGPVPGVIAGWMMFVYAAFNAEAFELNDWMILTGTLLLIINYLNILPVPPLDGHHVVKALLPPRWVVVQVIVIVAGVAIGVYVAYVLEFWPLAFIAAMQFFAVRGMWREARLLRRFDKERPPENVDESARVEWLLQRLEVLQGAPKTAVRRINQAQSILSQLDMRPMHWMHRSVVSMIFLVLVVVPLSALLAVGTGMFDYEASEVALAMHDELDAQRTELVAEAEAMSYQDLVSALYSDLEFAVPATEQQLRDAEARIGRELPEEIRDFYLANNGLPVLDFGPIGDVRPVDPELFDHDELSHIGWSGELHFYDTEDELVAVDKESVADWWQFGEFPCKESYMFINLEANSGQGALYHLDSGMARYHDSISGMLRYRWVEDAYQELISEAVERNHARAVLELENHSVAELVDELPGTNWFFALVSEHYRLSDPASTLALTDAEKRIGHPLPADYREFLSIHNGHFAAALLAIEDVRAADRGEQYMREYALEVAKDSLEDTATFSEDDMDFCWIIGGQVIDPDVESGDVTVSATLYWCPEQPLKRQYLDIYSRRFQPSFTDYLRHSVARTGAFL